MGQGLFIQLSAIGLVGALCATSAHAHTRTFHFAIVNQSLSQALRTYGQVCGQEIIFTEDVTAGVGAASLEGDFTAQDALGRLLDDSGLVAVRSPSGAVMIRRRSADAALGTTNAANGLEMTAYTGSVLTVAQVDGPAAIAPASSDPPATQPADATENNGQRSPVQEIVVTGSRIARRDFQSDSPIATIDQSALGAAGQPTLDKALGEMPQFAAAQGQSEVGDVQGATGFQGGQSYGDLRGLGANRALVLMDGRRLTMSNPNGSIDLNTIPMSMIENVEVITGGASAAYGSDAIAGVINFKLRQHFSGAELDVQHGATTHGDGANEHVSALLGGDFAEHRGNAVFAFEYAERSVVLGANRAFSSNIRQVGTPQEGIIPAGTLGSYPTIGAINTVLAGYPNTTPIAGSGPYLGALGVNTDGTIFTDKARPNCVQNYRGVGAPLVQITPDCSTVNVVNGRYFAIQVPLTKYNIFARTTYNVTDNISAYGQMTFMESSSRDHTAPGFTGGGKELFIPLNNPYVVNNPALQAILGSRTANPNNPQALTQPITYYKELVTSGNRVETFNYTVYQALGGLKGEIPGTDLSWDVYTSFGRSVFDNFEANDSSKTAFAAMLNGTANYHGSAGDCIGYAWNPFGVNALSAGCREFATRDNHNIDIITQKNIEGTLQGKLATLPAGELRFALGADYRGSSFDYRPDHGLATGDSFSYDNVVPTSGTQNVREVFGELLVPVLKDRWMVHDLSLDLGFRRSQYDGFGGVNTWKADLNWKPVSTFTVRGGYSKAIRAPSLGELFAPTTTGNLSVGPTPAAGDPCDSRSSLRSGPNAAQLAALCQAQGVPAALYANYQYGVDSVHGTSGGNPHLTPETANTYSVGGVWNPEFDRALLRNFSISVDYYSIKIANAVGSLSLTSILPRCFNFDGVSNPTYSTANLYCQQIVRDPNTGNIVLGHEGLLNLASYKTDGVDTQLDWNFGLSALGLSDAAGRIRMNSIIAYTRSFDVAALPGAPVRNYAGSIGDTEVSAEMAHPHWKANTAIGYAVGPVSAAVHWRYIAAMKDYSSVANPASTTAGVPAYSYFDLDAHWAAMDHFVLTVGITNLSDKQPPFVSGQPLTTDASTYDILGRSYYVGVKATF
ncbi:MAG: hypothetical protein JWM63_4571 [Gammaproteobacteria bacterium]|nr:hypothetical protein [Gammaproteobacteria bacterium]